MGMTRQERIGLHKKQERTQARHGVPVPSDLTEGVPVVRTTTEGVAEYVKHNDVLYKKKLDEANPIIDTISNYIITWSANEPTAGSTNTISNGSTVGNDNEGGQAIADLTEKLNSILDVLRKNSLIN